MSRATNVATDTSVPTEATETRRNAKGVVTAWRMPDGVLYTRNDKGEIKPVAFSISSGISEKFSDAIDGKVEEYNSVFLQDDGKTPIIGQEDEIVTRAQWFRIVVATSADYDLAQEPPREPKGEGLRQHRERVAQAVSGMATVLQMAENDPELRAKLLAAGVKLDG